MTENRAAHAKAPLKPKDTEPQTRQIKASTTDSFVAPGNVHDTQPYLGRLDRQCERFKLKPFVVGLDAGYL